jgi:hypothetical protein
MVLSFLVCHSEPATFLSEAKDLAGKTSRARAKKAPGNDREAIHC